MEARELKKYKLPDGPGVYFFTQGRQILYIGKATSLRDRVRSYFAGDIVESRGPRIKKMLAEATGIKYESTDSVLEALLLENALIKKHQPIYNVRERDDKSYWYVVMTNEKWPRVLMVRGKELITTIDPGDIKYNFGPFPKSTELREALKIIRKIFPFRDKCQPEQGKPCFNRQIGLCPGVCSGEVSAKEYAKNIRNIRYLLEGKKQKLLTDLSREMKQAAKDQKFEQAKRLRNQIFALEHIRDVSLIKRDSLGHSEGFRIEAYDIAHLAGKDTVGVMVVVTDGEMDKNGYRRFKIRGPGANVSNDIANLKEVLERRLKHSEWPKPDLVVVDGAKAQMNVAEKVLSQVGISVPIVAVTKDEFHRPKHILGDDKLADKFADDILLANSEAHRFALAYHTYRRRRII